MIEHHPNIWPSTEISTFKWKIVFETIENFDRNFQHAEISDPQFFERYYSENKNNIFFMIPYFLLIITKL